MCWEEKKKKKSVGALKVFGYWKLEERKREKEMEKLEGEKKYNGKWSWRFSRCNTQNSFASSNPFPPGNLNNLDMNEQEQDSRRMEPALSHSLIFPIFLYFFPQ